MSEQKQNTSNKQSSLTSENASMLVLENVYRAADNLDELMKSISRWEAEESSKSETASSMDCRTHQKVEQHLQIFFGLRRVFAEHQGDAEEDQMTDNTRGSITADISTQNSCDSDRTFKRKCGRDIFKKIGLFKQKPNKKVAKEQDSDETAKSDSSDSKSGSPATIASVCTTENIEGPAKADLSSVPLEFVDVEENDDDLIKNHIVREIDKAPGSSLDIETATKADLDSVPLEVLDVQKEEIPTDNGKSNSSSSPPPHQNRERSSVSEKDLGSVPLEMDDVEDNDVMEDTLVKKIDVTPGPFLDVRTATKADLKSVCSELLDVENEEILPEDKQYKKSTSSSSPQHLHRERSSVAEKDLSSVPLEFIVMDTNTKNTIYTLIMCFFDTLTKEQQDELRKCDYSMNMKNKIADLTAEVFMHITQAVSHNIEKCSIGGQLVDISGGLTPEIRETIEKMIHSVLSEIEQAHPDVIKKRWFSKLWENKVYPISDISDNNSAASLKFVDQNATPKNQAMRTRMTLLKRIRQFCCSLSCCSRTEDVNYLNPLSPRPASEVPARTVINGPQFI